MMVSVPMRGDGTIDEKEEAIVEAIGAWMRRYGDAVYATRPWTLLGEGPTESKAGDFNEGGQDSHYTPRDVRYVRKGAAVHAFTLGWPDDNIARFPALARTGSVQRVTIPGDSAPLAFRRTPDALEVDLPPALRNDIGVAVVVQGSGLV